MATIKDQKLDGVWAVAFKIHMTVVSLLIPPVIAWSAWITSEQFQDREFRVSGERFTQSDGRALEDKITNELAPKIEKVDVRVQGIERNSERIFTKLESIEQSLLDR